VSYFKARDSRGRFVSPSIQKRWEVEEVVPMLGVLLVWASLVVSMVSA
jgi:hypothetical protein